MTRRFLLFTLIAAAQENSFETIDYADIDTWSPNEQGL